MSVAVFEEKERDAQLAAMDVRIQHLIIISN